MKAIILVAGMGSRLGGHDQPKTLTRLVSGKTILQHQLYALSKYITLDQVILVVGYHKEKIMEQCPDLLYVYNPDYAFENTAKSLLRALKKCDEELLWLNGDLVFHPIVLENLLKFKKTSMLVSVGPVADEEVKYAEDIQGRIVEVSKSVEAAKGEAVGLNYCRQEDVVLFRHNLNQCAAQDYFERGVQLCIDQGMEVCSVPTERNLSVEVDFPEDLERANSLLTSWGAI